MPQVTSTEEKKRIEELLQRYRKQTEVHEDLGQETEKLREPSEDRPEPSQESQKLIITSQKGKEVTINRLEDEIILTKAKQSKKSSKTPKVKDESPDESAEETEEELSSELEELDIPMYELMTEDEMEEEYWSMTIEEERALVAQLTPTERAEHREMTEYYRVQAAASGQGLKTRHKEIKERAKRKTPGLPADLIQRLVKIEPDPAKQDIGRLNKVQKQAILCKQERMPRTTRPGTEKGYYIYVEDDGEIYHQDVNPEGQPQSVLDTETSETIVPDLITEADAEKYLASEEEKDDDTVTISSTSTADYDRDEVESILLTIAESFHKIGDEYERLCRIVPHMTKVQAAQVISRLPVMPFMKVEAKTEPEAETPEPIIEQPQSETTEAQRIEETNTGKINIAADVELAHEETIKESKKETEEPDDKRIENFYKRYRLTGTGKTPEEQIEKAIKEINYKNLIVVIATGDQAINRVGGIRPVMQKWGLSYSVVQRALSGIKEHRQGGRQYDKQAGRPQRRSKRVRDTEEEEEPKTKKDKKRTGKKSKEQRKPKEDEGNDNQPPIKLTICRPKEWRRNLNDNDETSLPRPLHRDELPKDDFDRPAEPDQLT